MDVVLMETFVENAQIQPPAKPYGWSKIQSRILAIAEEERNKVFTSGAIQILKTKIDRLARAHAEATLYEPKPPPYFTWAKMKKIWDQLWYPAPTAECEARHKAMCISFITYSTGARTIEICYLRIEDLEEIEDNGVTFLRCPLRTSKTNTRKTSRESIILTITKKEMYPILKWIKKVIGIRKKGFVFPNMDTRKVHYHLKVAAKVLKWPTAPRPHGCRMGFVLNSSVNGVEDEHIVNVCRWKDNQMLKYYRNHFLETTIHWSAYKIAMEN